MKRSGGSREVCTRILGVEFPGITDGNSLSRVFEKLSALVWQENLDSQEFFIPGWLS